MLFSVNSYYFRLIHGIICSLLALYSALGSNVARCSGFGHNMYTKAGCEVCACVYVFVRGVSARQHYQYYVLTTHSHSHSLTRIHTFIVPTHIDDNKSKHTHATHIGESDGSTGHSMIRFLALNSLMVNQSQP